MAGRDLQVGLTGNCVHDCRESTAAQVKMHQRVMVSAGGSRGALIGAEKRGGSMRLNFRRIFVFGLLFVFAACGESNPAPAAEEPLAAAETGKVVTVEKIASGAAIAGANGIHFGPDGLLYVASVFGSELIAVDPDSGEIRKRLGPAEGVFGPDDVAFAPDGSFYWTTILTGEVAGFTAAGERKVAATLTPGVNPITFSDTGRLFVAQCFFGTGLYELDPAGLKPPRSIAEDLGPQCGLNGMDWGPDGRLYGPRWFAKEVVSVDVDSGQWRVEATGFKTPAAVKFNSKGELHVLDTADGTVLRVGKDGITVVARIEPGLDNFAFDANDRLFVSSFVEGFVARIEADGSVTKLLPGGLAHPGGITILQRDGKTEVVVADFHSIRGYDPNTGTATFVQKSVFGVDEMGSILTIAADGSNLLLSSFTDNSVRVWDPVAARVLRRFDGLAQPVGVAAYAGGIAVALHGSKSVVLLGDGEPVVLASDLMTPTDLQVSGDDLLVSDRASGAVLRVASKGVAIPAQTVVSGLQAPEGLALSDRGLIVVEGESGRVLLVADGVAMPLAEVSRGSLPATPAMPPAMIVSDAAALGDKLYVTAETEHALYRLTGF
jgi:sugar lactone lactonase YvrE